MAGEVSHQINQLKSDETNSNAGETEHPTSSKAERFSCDVCGSVFSNLSSFLDLKERHFLKPTNLEHLIAKSDAKKEINSSSIPNTEEKQFACEICEKIFPGVRIFFDHMESHLANQDKSVGPVTSTPLSVVKNQVVLNSPEVSISNKKEITSSVSHPTLLKRQLDEDTVIKKEENPTTCGTCGKKFVRKWNLQAHIRIHMGEKPHTCGTCGKKFVRKWNLQAHIQIHMGEKLHTCGTCGKQFSRKNALRTHIRIHTGEKPHACGTCGKPFSQKSALHTHIRIHTGEKLHTCGTCGKGFSQKGALKCHIRTHTGEKPFNCGTCGRGFAVSCNLLKHITRTGGNCR